MLNVAPSADRCTATNDLLPDVTSMTLVSVANPSRVTLTTCWPGVTPGRLYGVTQAGSLRPSIWICAPSGVELTDNSPGTTVFFTGAAARCGLVAYRGVTVTSGSDSADAASGAGACASGAGAELAAGSVVAGAGGCTGCVAACGEPCSSAFSR